MVSMRSASGRSTWSLASTTTSAVLSGSLASLVYLDLRSTCDSALVPGTNDGVRLPITDAAFCRPDGRSLIDVDTVGDQAAPGIPCPCACCISCRCDAGADTSFP